MPPKTIGHHAIIRTNPQNRGPTAHFTIAPPPATITAADKSDVQKQSLDILRICTVSWVATNQSCKLI